MADEGKNRLLINTVTGYDVEKRILYDKLKGISKTEMYSPTVANMRITPTVKEYAKGFFHRYFIARHDATEASEVSKKIYDKTIEKLPEDLYYYTSFKWILKDNYTYDGSQATKAQTAFNNNETTVYFKSKNFPQLLVTIEDFAEFVG